MSGIRWTPNKRHTEWKARFGMAYGGIVLQHDGKGFMVAAKAPGVRNQWRADIPTLDQAKEYGNSLLMIANHEAELIDQELQRKMASDA